MPQPRVHKDTAFLFCSAFLSKTACLLVLVLLHLDLCYHQRNSFWPDLPRTIAGLIWSFYLLQLKIYLEISNWQFVLEEAVGSLVFSIPEGKCFLRSKHCMIMLFKVLHRTSVLIPINCERAGSIFKHGNLFSMIPPNISKLFLKPGWLMWTRHF